LSELRYLISDLHTDDGDGSYAEEELGDDEGA
jgi:hypothetical protein